MEEDEIGEYPDFCFERPEEPMDEIFFFLLNKEILGACYFHSDNQISIYSFCPKVESELPYIKDVVYAVDHESMHWLLFNFIEDYWISSCFDKIARKIECFLEPYGRWW